MSHSIQQTFTAYSNVTLKFCIWYHCYHHREFQFEVNFICVHYFIRIDSNSVFLIEHLSSDYSTTFVLVIVRYSEGSQSEGPQFRIPKLQTRPITITFLQAFAFVAVCNKVCECEIDLLLRQHICR